MEHNELAREMQQIDKLPVTERIALARKRRKQQLAIYSKWAKTDNLSNSKSRSSPRKGIRFSPEVQLLETAARAATDKGAIEEMHTILKSGINPNQMNHDGLTALHQACIDGSLEMVTLLLKAGADVNVVDRDLWTPLHAAATCGHFKIVTTLIKAGANLIAINGDGDLPHDITEDEVTQHYLEHEMTKKGFTQEFINHARQATYEQINDDINYLLANGGDINQPLDQGGTLLHTAIANFFNDLIEKLLGNGANSTARDEDGWEPIHVAAYWCNDEALETLAKRTEINLRSMTDNGETPYELCDDPELKSTILQIISDRPEIYKFGKSIKDTHMPVTGDLWESMNETPQSITEGNDNPEAITRKNELHPEIINSTDVGNAQKHSEENLPLNPLLNLQATELSERRNSVKEAKHMAPMKRMNSIEIGNISKKSPYAAKTTLLSSNENDKNVNTGKKPHTAYEESLESLQPAPKEYNKLNANDFSRKYENLDQKTERQLVKKEGFLTNKDNAKKQPVDNENTTLSTSPNIKFQTLPSSLDQDKKDNKREMHVKELIYLPRKKNPAPPIPQGTLLDLKRQRQEARSLQKRTVSDTLNTMSQLFDPPPSPTMIRYHYKMVPDEIIGEAFIREKKCVIM